MSPEQMLREFHAAADMHLPSAPGADAPPGFATVELRQKLLDDEVQELREAVDARDIVAIADACADIVYVVVGTAVSHGIPFDAVLAEVHRSNMTKFIGGALVDERGKILKGPHYEPPRIAALLGEDDTDARAS